MIFVLISFVGDLKVWTSQFIEWMPVSQAYLGVLRRCSGSCIILGIPNRVKSHEVNLSYGKLRYR